MTPLVRTSVKVRRLHPRLQCLQHLPSSQTPDNESLVTQDSDREAITGKLGMFCCCYGAWLSMTSIETMHDYEPLDEGTLARQNPFPSFPEHPNNRNKHNML